jgi:hypothetical protein
VDSAEWYGMPMLKLKQVQSVAGACAVVGSDDNAVGAAVNMLWMFWTMKHHLCILPLWHWWQNCQGQKENKKNKKNK